jgi:hypothetical protein
MNTRKVDGLMECDDCGKVCNGIQGIRGHRRSCPGREPAAVNQINEPRKPVVEPGQSMVGGQNQQITLGSRLNADGVEMVLRIYEPLRTLREQIRDSLPIRESFDAVARTNKWPRFDDWFDLGRDVVHLELATEHILQRAFVSRDEPWALYQLAIQTRDRWLFWRLQEAISAWRQRCSESEGADKQPPVNDFEDICSDFGIPELERNWKRVIEGLRWLTAHTRATL